MRVRLILGICLIGSVAGCGGEATGDKGAPRAAVTEAADGAIKRRLAEDLPAVGEYLPPLDDGKVEIAGPQGWIQLPNTSRQLAAFAPDKSEAYPRINVTADDSPLPVLGDLTEENAAQFVTVFDEPYRKKRKSLPEAGKPIVLGGTPFIRQVRLVSINKKQLVLQWLATVQKGRLYTVDLFCEVNPAKPEDYATPLTEARDYAYAVAAHLSVVGPASDTPVTPPADSLPAETTEEKPKADEKPVEKPE